MSKKLLILSLAIVLMCSLGQFVFADIADPFFSPSRGGTFSVALVIAVLIVVVVLIIRRIRRRR